MGSSSFGLWRLKCVLLVLAAIAACTSPDERDADRPVRIEPVGFTDVHLSDEFLAPRMEINRTVTIPHLARQNEETGRMTPPSIWGR